MSTDLTSGPLAGVKVLDLSRMYPGAFCTQLLADLGADVLKVEGPGAGDGLRHVAISDFNATHTALNRGKRSLVLNLKSPAAASVLTRLVEGSDVVVESHRPGQLDQLGVGYGVMSAANPRIVWCSITGFGDHGPLAQAAGHDITYLGYAGMLGLLADSPAGPSTPGVTIAVPLAASLAAVGILAAVVEARAHREGIAARRQHGRQRDVGAGRELRAGAANAPAPGWGTFAARNVYTCSDGRQVTRRRHRAPLLGGAVRRLGDAGAGRAAREPRAPTRRRPPGWPRFSRPDRRRTGARTLAYAGGVGPVNDVADLLDDPAFTERRSTRRARRFGRRSWPIPLRFGGDDGDAALVTASPIPRLGADTDAAARRRAVTPRRRSQRCETDKSRA